MDGWLSPFKTETNVGQGFFDFAGELSIGDYQRPVWLPKCILPFLTPYFPPKLCSLLVSNVRSKFKAQKRSVPLNDIEALRSRLWGTTAAAAEKF